MHSLSALARRFWALLRAKTIAGFCLRMFFVYWVVFALMVAFQDRLLLHPATLTLAQWRSGAEAHGLQVLPYSDALVCAPPRGTEVKATVVLFHGNGGNAAQRSSLCPEFTSRGYRAVFAEYPGFGPRQGSYAASELLADAKQLLAQVRKTWPSEPLALWGESFGSGVAAQLATSSKADSVVLLVPFKRLGDVAARTYPMFPVRWGLQYAYDNDLALAGYVGPVSLVVAAHDEVVGTDQGYALFEALKSSGRTRLHSIEGGHNDWPVRMTAQVWKQVLP